MPETTPGDYNGDGTVDAADDTVWRDTLGQTGTGLAADGTSPNGVPDGVVDPLDYAFWREHFGQSSATGSGRAEATVVPEPSALCLIATILVVSVLTYRLQRVSGRVSNARWVVDGRRLDCSLQRPHGSLGDRHR